MNLIDNKAADIRCSSLVRTSRLEPLFKKGVLKNFAKFQNICVKSLF